MSDARYDVVFSGRLVEGAPLEQVKANVAKLFKVEVAKIERLFSGKPVVLKKGVDEQTAKKYLVAMQKAGAICEVKGLQQAEPASAQGEPSPQAAAPAANPEPAVRKPANPFLSDDTTAADSGTGGRATFETGEPKPTNPFMQEEKTEGGKSEAEIAAGEAGETKYVIKEPPQGFGELGSASLDEPGAVLVQHQETPPPQVDTSGLSMDEPGAELVEHEETPPPQVDTSGLSMDEPGATLAEHEEVPDLDVDISGLDMDEPGVTIVEHEEEEQPDIDTSKLSLDQ